MPDPSTPHSSTPEATGRRASGGSWIVDPQTGERRLAEEPTGPALAEAPARRATTPKKGA